MDLIWLDYGGVVKPTPDGTYYGGIRTALSEIAYSLGIIKRGILK